MSKLREKLIDIGAKVASHARLGSASKKAGDRWVHALRPVGVDGRTIDG
jgi:hypothetical protein